MPEEVKTEAMRELNRLARMSPASPEYGVTRTYLEWMANLPWSISSGAQVDVQARGRDPRRRPLRSGEGEGSHSRLPGRAAAEARAEGADPVLRGTSRRGQDVAGQIDRARAGPQVRAHLHGRHARRGGDPRPPPHLYRRAARADHPGAAARRRQRSGLHAGRGGQARAAISAAIRRRRCSKCWTRSRTPPSATTTWTCRSTFRRSCSSPRPTCSTRSRTRCATAWRSSRSRATPSRRR